MHHIVYTSTLNFSFAETDLQRLLGRWRATNERLDVTGVLLYSDGYIMQALEGEAEAIHGLFNTIAADARHRAVCKLADGEVKSRAFADWSMRFRAVDAADFERFVQQMKAAPNHASSLTPLLESFMEASSWK